jgi:excisionase family DNA binding protein
LHDGRVVYSTVEAADVLHVNRATIHALINQGELVGFKVGRVMRVTAESLSQYVTRQISARQC